ncbi:uncharacterized protein LOC144112421 [Amblyomma americanum]
MTHVFVKWQEEKWDVYAIRALDADVGMQLLAKESAIEELRGIMVMVEWEASQPPASATLLGFGTERAMEWQRTRLALEAEVGAVPNTPETESGTQPPTKRQKNKIVQNEVSDIGRAAGRQCTGDSVLSGIGGGYCDPPISGF